MDDRSGSNIKGYELLERIGAGGFGAVYRARQSTIGREVAIKIILPEHANQPDFIRRFEAEAQLVARLEHMHITPLYDYWRDPSGAYIVMRFLRGGSLKEALEEQPYELNPCVAVLDQVTSALAMAHRDEIIHRDLKPGNILLDEDGNAYLADFGIAKDLHDLEGDLTRSGIIGSLDYISPEQARNEPVSPQTDIYSLGVVLYEMLVGEHPFSDCSSVERLYKHLNEPLPEIANLGDNGVHPQINAVIQKATAKNPARRYPDVLDLAAAFRAAAGISPATLGEAEIENLTMREQEVLRLIIDGHSNREIANQLVITLGTVKWYVNQIYRKLGVRSRVQAISRASELKLVVPTSKDDQHPVQVDQASTVSLPKPENPYRGLRPFHSVDQRFFFGRESLVQTLIQRMAAGDDEISNRFLAIVGPSGSGKSSLVRAGLIPALWRGALPGSERWFVVDMLPGSHPLDELEIALLQVAADQAPNLREQLNRDMRGLQRIAQLILPKDETELVVIVDQFEEIFTLVEDEAARAHFLDLLYTSVTDPRSRVRVVVTLRADFYDRPLHYPDFGELLRSRMETVLPLSAEELERAIRRPAELVGVIFEDGLVATIIDEVLYQPGALPLLQYALTELFDRREGRVLTKQAYQAMGGTIGALASRSDEIFEGLTHEGQSLTRQMFLRLVTLGEGVEDTRRRVAYTELIALVDGGQGAGRADSSIDLMEDVIETFTQYRLLSMDHDTGTRIPTVEVAHEAILREWERLSQWLDESRDDIREQRVLARTSTEWEAANCVPGFLLRGSRLDLTEAWVEKTDLALTASERAFLADSLEARHQREQEEAARQAHEVHLELRSRRFLWALVGVFAVAAFIAVLLSIVAFNQSNIAQENAATATYAQGEALVIADSHATQQAIAEGEAEARATQQAIAEGEASARATQQAIAEEQAEARAVAEAQAIDERNKAIEAEQEALKQASIGLAAQALAEMESANSERGVLLALAALEEYPYTPQAEAALARAVQESLQYKQIFDEKALNLEGHWVDWSPDGSRIALGTSPNEDGEHSAVVFEFESGEVNLVLPLVIPDSFGIQAKDRCSVQQINWSPDGTKLALAVNNNFLEEPQKQCYYLQIYDSASGELLLDLDSQGEFAVDWSPDGTKLLTGGENGAVRVWDAHTGEVLLEMAGHKKNGAGIFPDQSDRVLAARFSPDGKKAASFSTGGVVHIWDAETGELIGTFEHPQAFLTDTFKYPSQYKIALAWSPSGDQFVTAWYDGLARIWDLDTGEVDRLLAGHTSNIIGVDWSPDGTYILTQGLDGSARLWVASTGQVLIKLPTAGYGNAAWSKQSDRIAVPVQIGLLTWDTSTLPPVLISSTPVQYTTNDGKWTPDGKLFILNGIDGLVFDWAGDKTSRQIAPNEGYVDFSPNSRQMVASEGWNKTPPQIIDLYSGEVINELQNPDDIIYYNSSWSHDGTRVASSTYPGFWTVIWDPETGEELARSETTDGFMLQINFSPDDHYIAAPSIWGTGSPVYIFDSQTGETLRELPSDSGWSMISKWSPDGHYLAVGYQDGSVKIWDTDDWTISRVFDAHQIACWDVVWSPNGQRIISGDDNSIIYVWEVESGNIVSAWDMQAALGGFQGVDWHPDGNFVAIQGMGVPIPIFRRVWQSTEELIDYAHECCVWRELTTEERTQFGLPEE